MRRPPQGLWSLIWPKSVPAISATGDSNPPAAMICGAEHRPQRGTYLSWLHTQCLLRGFSSMLSAAWVPAYCGEPCTGHIAHMQAAQVAAFLSLLPGFLKLEEASN